MGKLECYSISGNEAPALGFMQRVLAAVFGIQTEAQLYIQNHDVGAQLAGWSRSHTQGWMCVTPYKKEDHGNDLNLSLPYVKVMQLTVCYLKIEMSHPAQDLKRWHDPFTPREPLIALVNGVPTTFSCLQFCLSQIDTTLVCLKGKQTQNGKFQQ